MLGPVEDINRKFQGLDSLEVVRISGGYAKIWGKGKKVDSQGSLC